MKKIYISAANGFSNMIGSVFQYGYALGVMNQLIDDLEQVFINRGTSVAMTFTTGKLLYMIEIMRFLLSLS